MRLKLLFSLILLLSAYWAWDAALTLAPGTGRAKRAQMTAELNTIRMALEQYGTDHDGRYPAEAAIGNVQTLDIYLPEDRLPRNPYGPTDAPVRLVADAAFFAHPERAPAYAPGTFVYHLPPGNAGYQLAGVVEGAPGDQLVGWP